MLFQLDKDYKNTTGNTYDLSEYYIDSLGNLFSYNSETYCTYDKNLKRRVLYRLSDNTLNSQGIIINTLRDTEGKKVTLRRDFIKKNYRGLQQWVSSHSIVYGKYRELRNAELSKRPLPVPVIIEGPYRKPRELSKVQEIAFAFLIASVVILLIEMGLL